MHHDDDQTSAAGDGDPFEPATLAEIAARLDAVAGGADETDETGEVSGTLRPGQPGRFAEWELQRSHEGRGISETATVVGLLLAMADRRFEDVDLLLGALGPETTAYTALILALGMSRQVAAGAGIELRALLEGMAQAAAADEDL